MGLSQTLARNPDDVPALEGLSSQLLSLAVSTFSTWFLVVLPDATHVSYLSEDTQGRGCRHSLDKGLQITCNHMLIVQLH